MVVEELSSTVGYETRWITLIKSAVTPMAVTAPPALWGGNERVRMLAPCTALHCTAKKIYIARVEGKGKEKRRGEKKR